MNLTFEHITEDETVSADELFNDIMAGFAELQAFEEDSRVNFSEQVASHAGKTLRITEFVDGERLPPAEMTAAELKARQAARGAKTTSARNGSASDVAGDSDRDKTASAFRE